MWKSGVGERSLVNMQSKPKNPISQFFYEKPNHMMRFDTWNSVFGLIKNESDASCKANQCKLTFVFHVQRCQRIKLN